MDFVFADDELGIEMNLIPLRPSTEPFTIHFYQHSGEFFASKTRIGNGINAVAQFRYFFQKARQNNSDLILSPEYSCPSGIIFLK